jgi:hypothetical protein
MWYGWRVFGWFGVACVWLVWGAIWVLFVWLDEVFYFLWWLSVSSICINRVFSFICAAKCVLHMLTLINFADSKKLTSIIIKVSLILSRSPNLFYEKLKPTFV